MKGLIVINAYPNGKKFIKQAARIAEELEKLGVDVDVMRNGEVYACIDQAGMVTTSLSQKYNFAIYLDKDKYLGELLERNGLRLFNSAKAVATCDDKLTTYLALAESALPLAKSIPAPLCYTPKAKVDVSFLEKVAKVLGFPLVVKKSYGSFGAGVQLVHGMPELIKTAQEFLYEPHFFQQYIAESKGKDIRVIVVGGKAVAAMERRASGEEFRSNIELGGEGRKTEVQEEYAFVAEQAAKILHLDYCGVDLLQGENGPILCEVNSNAFFEGLEKTTGFNVAEAYAEYVAREMRGR